ncbi:MAG: hypothetical protein WAL97_04210 [Halobacteriota archaeon]|jgi:uncharacterized membrane protein
MAERGLLSGIGMILLAIILAIILALFPSLIIWLAWLAIIILFLGGIAAVFTRRR